MADMADKWPIRLELTTGHPDRVQFHLIRVFVMFGLVRVYSIRFQLYVLFYFGHRHHHFSQINVS